MHAGGVLEISRWQAPQARRHRIMIAPISHPGGVPEGCPRPRRGRMSNANRVRWRRAFRRLPPASFRHASSVDGATTTEPRQLMPGGQRDAAP